jgi:thiosulfate reductase/polysulfide reductase chain A
MDIMGHISNLNFYLFGSFPGGEPGGLMLNIVLAAAAVSFSFIFGVLLGYSRLSSRIYIKLPCIVYIETVRAVPLILIIFWFYYVIPTLFGIFIPVFWSVVLSLSLYAAAYEAEIVRSGITAVSRGQLDSALATGFSRYEAMAHVILPQAFRMMIPSFISFFVSLLKDTSTVFIIGMVELTRAGIIISESQPDHMIAAYITVAAVFFLICSNVSFIAEKLEKKIGVFDFQSYRPDVSRDEFMLFPRYKLQTLPALLSHDDKKKQKKYGMLIDLNKCIGCYACQVTCKAEYNLPLGVFRCTVDTVQSGRHPEVKKLFVPRLCNQCNNPPCIEACEEKNALFKTPDGVVILDNSYCPDEIRCKKCYELCPYDAIDINPYTKLPEKCDFCYDRIRGGELPVCVQSCMGKAIIFGDLNDKNSEISLTLKRRQVKALKPELGAHPLVFYLSNGGVSNYDLLKNYDPSKRQRKPRVPVKEKDLVRTGERSKIVYSTDSMCPSECGITVRVQDGVAKKIYGNPHTLINNGTFCAKGAAGLQMTYSPYRIKTPLMRTGQRGEDAWKPVTWEEAADYVTKKLIEIKKKYGAETVFFNGGDMSDGIAYERLFRAFGTPHLLHQGSVCDPNRQWGHRLMTGDSRPLPDVQRPLLIRNDSGELSFNNKHDARLILHVGVNPFVSTRFNYMSNGIPTAREENNCKYIVVDPSYTNSAALADIWLPITPGTDSALLACMLFFIIENCCLDYPSQCYIDQDFVEKYTTGWPEFQKAFLSYTKRKDPSNNLFYFSLEWGEEKTGISARDIKKISHLFGITKPASIEVGMHGTAHHTNGDVTSIIATALCLITGNIDRPGGLVLMGPHKPKKGMKTAGFEFLERTVSRMVNGGEVQGRVSELHKDRYGDFPAVNTGTLVDLPKKMRDGITLKHGPFKGYTYPVKAYITRAGNPVMTAGSTPEWIDALTALDERGGYNVELNVCIDTHVTVTGKYADIIFPEAGFLERMGLSSVYTMSPEIALRDQAINPLYESKTSFEIMMYLSEAFMKNGDPDITAEDFRKRYKTEEDFINEQLRDAPTFYNIGSPLPYPDIPEGALIVGVPDNPRAVLNGKVIRDGDLVTVEWLRNNHGVAVWPASYFRYKKSDASLSGICPQTQSGKFEFHFSCVEEINKEFGTNYPTTFYWTDCKWNPKTRRFKNIASEYPFQLISGRVHHSMTITVVCPYLSETRTECMDQFNNPFQYTVPGLNSLPDTYGMPRNQKVYFKADSVSIPVFAFNRTDGAKLHIKTGEVVVLETPLKKRVTGKAFLTEEVMPGVIKTAFGPGGQKAAGLGFMSKTHAYTPNINELHDSENFNTITGTPGFGDIMVKVIKQEIYDRQ